MKKQPRFVSAVRRVRAERMGPRWSHSFQTAQRLRQERDHPDPSTLRVHPPLHSSHSRTALNQQDSAALRAVGRPCLASKVFGSSTTSSAKPPDFEDVRTPWCFQRAHRRAGCRHDRPTTMQHSDRRSAVFGVEDLQVHPPPPPPNRPTSRTFVRHGVSSALTDGSILRTACFEG